MDRDPLLEECLDDFEDDELLDEDDPEEDELEDEEEDEEDDEEEEDDREEEDDLDEELEDEEEDVVDSASLLSSSLLDFLPSSNPIPGILIEECTGPFELFSVPMSSGGCC